MGGFAGRDVLVTGGAGFVGSWVCESLVAQGARVVCVDNFSTGRPENVAHLAGSAGFRLVEADVCEGVPLEHRVDLVLHLASPASPEDYRRLPLETLRVGSVGTLEMLALAERCRARFLLASTSEVYGDPEVHPQTEDYRGAVNPVGPRSVYDEAKRFAEAATSAYRRDRGLDTTIARIFNTYGPRMRTDDGRAVPAFVTQALAGRPLTVAGDGTQTRSLCYVTDTVAGLLAVAGSDLAGPVNIGNDAEATILELAMRVRDLAGSDSEIGFVGLPEDDPRRRCPDLALAREALGWHPMVPAREGLRATLEWFASVVGGVIDGRPEPAPFPGPGEPVGPEPVRRPR